MDVDLDTEAFLPAKNPIKTTKSLKKKRLQSEDDSMQTEEIQGVQGRSKAVTKRKKTKPNYGGDSKSEVRKIPVPSHR